MRPPSWARHRSTYVPGSLKVVRVTHVPSGGTGGVSQFADHGEFPLSRVSSQTFLCGGSRVTLPAPRYTNQESLRPVAELGVPRPLRPRRMKGGRIDRSCGFGTPSSLACAVKMTGCPTLTALLLSPSTLSMGALFPNRSLAPPAPPPGTDPPLADQGVILDHEWEAVRSLMLNYMGLVRSRGRLDRAVTRLAEMREWSDDLYRTSKPSSDLAELRNISLVGLIMAMSARAREESRGLHTRLDFPETDPVPRESWSRFGEGGVEVTLRPLGSSKPAPLVD